MPKQYKVELEHVSRALQSLQQSPHSAQDILLYTAALQTALHVQRLVSTVLKTFCTMQRGVQSVEQCAGWDESNLSNVQCIMYNV